MDITSCCLGFSLLSLLFSKVVPCVLILQAAVASWKTMQKAPELREPPYSPHLFAAEHLTLIVAAVAIPWEVVKGIIVFCLGFMGKLETKHASHPILLPVALVEVGIIASMAVVLQMQSTYLPTGTNCKHAAKWQYDDIGKPTLFVTLAKHWTASKKKSPEYICTQFVYKRTIGIIYTVIHSLFALPFLFVLIFILLLIGAVIYGKCRAAVRFVISFTIKILRLPHSRAKPRNDSEEMELASLLPTGLVDSASKADSVSRLDSASSVDQPDHTPHFANVMRDIKIYGGQSLTTGPLTVSEIRKLTCTPDTKSECWGCGNQICKDCKITEKLDDPPTTMHLEECETICTPCQFLRSFHPSKYPQFLFKSRPCSHGPAKDGTKLERNLERDICSTCAAADPATLLERRTKLESAEMANLEVGKVVCALCRTSVTIGPRWWICSTCGVSCNNRCHSAWISWKNM